MIQKIRTYSELSKFHSIESRYNYLRLSSSIGVQTFGWDRYLNQLFYRSPEWKRIRDLVIIRDEGCDLGIKGFEIHDKILIHHMNPISKEDILGRNPDSVNLEFLISTSSRTHQAIHYGDISLLPQVPIQRRLGDTKLW